MSIEALRAAALAQLALGNHQVAMPAPQLCARLWEQGQYFVPAGAHIFYYFTERREDARVIRQCVLRVNVSLDAASFCVGRKYKHYIYIDPDYPFEAYL